MKTNNKTKELTMQEREEYSLLQLQKKELKKEKMKLQEKKKELQKENQN